MHNLSSPNSIGIDKFGKLEEMLAIGKIQIRQDKTVLGTHWKSINIHLPADYKIQLHSSLTHECQLNINIVFLFRLQLGSTF